MDLQFFGANCITLSYKNARVVIDDNLTELGAKSITKPEDVGLFTYPGASRTTSRLMIDMPGEYEVSDISVIGIPARSHMDEEGKKSATMFKLIAGDVNVLVTGHIYPELSDDLLEAIGIVDVLFVPVGGSGYTTDPLGALKLIKSIEPKLVIPTHYADKALNYPVPQTDLESALKDIAMEPKERIAKLRLKPGELSEVAQLVVLEKS
ncbi:MAG: MBL fold metallo-hydrolase [Candidatus Saccharibacteria bacterium]